MVMPVRFSTPYYLAGDQKKRFHTNHGEKAALTAAGLGATGAFLRNPKYRGIGRQVARSRGFDVTDSQAGSAGKLLLGAGAATAAYGGFHYARAANYKRKERKAYYVRTQNGKRIRARMPRRRKR